MNSEELSPTMKDLYARLGIEYPPTKCLDARSTALSVGDKVFVARTDQARGTVLDFGKIEKLDIKKQRVLIDWSESPIEAKCVYSKKGGGCGVFPRRKSWVWNRLCGLADKKSS